MMFVCYLFSAHGFYAGLGAEAHENNFRWFESSKDRIEKRQL
jgi:hypothetical protein